MRDLAAKVGITDVGLKKRFLAQGLSIPPQGYWNKVRAGRAVPRPPRIPPRGPGMSDTITVPPDLALLLPPAPPSPAAGPFATSRVPEDLEGLRAIELAAIGKGCSVTARGQLYAAIADLLDEEHRCLFGPPTNLEPAFTTPPSIRHLAIVNAIFRTLAGRGYLGFAERSGATLSCGATIGHTLVAIDVAVAGHKFPPGTNLIGRITRAPDKARLVLAVEGGRAWADDEAGELEGKIAEIAADMIVAGEAGYREGLRRAAGMDEEHERAKAAERARQNREIDELRQRSRAVAEILIAKADAIRAVALMMIHSEDENPGMALWVLRERIRSAEGLARDIAPQLRRLAPANG